MIKLSYIIPFYNGQDSILQCLDSILSIDLPKSDYEIIIVDDCSPVSAQSILAEYIAKYSNIQIVRHEVNKRQGGAKNTGIRLAKGQYIVFVDADDYLSKDGLERMLDLAEQHQADIVKYKIHSLKHDAPCIYNSLKDFDLNIEIISGKAQALKRYNISDYHVVDAIFKSATIKENGVHFFTDLHLREDDVFMGAFYSVASQVIVTNLPLYNYYTSSYYSHTHSQPIERQRVLIQSGLLAIKHRKAFIEHQCPNQSFPYERLKYMRWVCSIRNAISAQYTFNEYKALLRDFRKEGVYPLDYAWIKVAGWDYAFKPYMKRVLQTFMMNNPWLVWLPAKWYYNRRK